MKEEEVKDIKKSKIEDYFINQINKKYFIKINIDNSNDILNKIYDIIKRYKIVNDASGFSAIFNKVGYVSNIYAKKIIKSIEERKYSVNTLANFLDAGNPLISYIEEDNSSNYKNIDNVINIINIYNKFLEEIFYNKNKHLFPKIDLTIKNINFKLFVKENNKINENKNYIKNMLINKGFNSIVNIVNIIQFLDKKYINEKYFLLRLKSMGDRIQSYEVYYSNKNLLTPIIKLRNNKLKKYEGNKKLFLATNDKMLTYFSINAFDKMNILSIYKDNIIIKNDFY